MFQERFGKHFHSFSLHTFASLLSGQMTTHDYPMAYNRIRTRFKKPPVVREIP